MIKAQFRFAPDILRRLGEELNPHPDRGILELAKNAYDADAHSCTILLTNTERAGGTITVSDDGSGMGVDEIITGWLVLGRSGKLVAERTILGRTPSGSKGLGRLAALRLGSRALLTTRPKEDSRQEHNLLIDWKDFERAEIVEEVNLTIESSQRKENDSHGTTIYLEDLTTEITRSDVRRLARELILLADPFGDSPEGFRPVLIAPEFAEFEKLVQQRYFDDAEYHLIATVDKNGRANASIVDWKGKQIFVTTHDELTQGSNQHYRCPSAKFDLWVFILDSTTFSTRSSTIGEVRRWLDVFGGVHLYQNELRVSPYGYPGNDWLELNLARVRSPEERPSTNTVIGRVVAFDRSAVLLQKTDRSGFIETESFRELRRFAQDTCEWMARRRLDVAQARRAKERSVALEAEKPTKKKLFEAIERAHEPAREQIKKAAEAYERAQESDKDKLRREIQLYRTLSTAGITAATFAHESKGNPLKAITIAVDAIERRARAALGVAYSQQLERPVQTIVRATERLSVLSAVTSKLLDHEKRRLTRVELNQVIRGVLETFKPFTEGRDVEVLATYCEGSPYLRGSEAAIESIVTNLLNNSLAALEESTVGKHPLFIFRPA